MTAQFTDFVMGDSAEAFRRMFAGCAGCGERHKGMRALPGDGRSGKRYCGLCALKEAVKALDARGAEGHA